MCGYFCIGFIHFMLKRISSKYLWNRGKKFKGYELFLFSSITFNTRIPHKLFKKINEMIERYETMKQSIFDPRPENCLKFSKKSPQKIV